MKPYEKYKYSGVPWIGDIPDSWEVRKLKYFAKIKNGQDYKKVVADNGYPVMGSGGQFAYAQEYLWDKPSVLLGRKGTVDKPLYIDVPFWTVDTMYYTDVNNCNVAKYLYYLATTIQFPYYQYGSAVPSMTQEDLNNIFFATPKNMLLQQKIADFLDKKTSDIDSLIADKQKLIELLKEKRQAIISETVTKGLDKAVAMKDSGISWIGDIPEGWEISKLKFFTSKIGSGKTPKGGNEVYVSSGILFIRSQNVLNAGLNLTDVAFITEEMDEALSTSRVKYNDILLNITGASIGRCCIFNLSDTLANVNQHVCIIRTSNNITSNYIQYVLTSNIGQTNIRICQTGANREGLNFEEIANFPIPLPSLTTQQKIADYLAKQLLKIDTTIADITEQIEKLKEYRQAIISEVVTGKVEV